jgi:hypothetical protein
MQAQNIPRQNDPIHVLQFNDDPLLLAVRPSSSMEVTSTTIHPRDNRPPITNNTHDSWMLLSNIIGATIKDPELTNKSRFRFPTNIKIYNINFAIENSKI